MDLPQTRETCHFSSVCWTNPLWSESQTCTSPETPGSCTVLRLVSLNRQLFAPRPPELPFPKRRSRIPAAARRLCEVSRWAIVMVGRLSGRLRAHLPDGWFFTTSALIFWMPWVFMLLLSPLLLFFPSHWKKGCYLHTNQKGRTVWLTIICSGMLDSAGSILNI